MISDKSEGRFCYVHCGLPDEQCACIRERMRAVFADLAAAQEPLGPEFQRALNDNREDLYEE